jgi:Flp pilus assembly pilin Flp
VRKGKHTRMGGRETCLRIAMDHGMIAGAREVRYSVTAVEYRMIWGLIVVVLATALTNFGVGLNHALTSVAAHL